MRERVRREEEREPEHDEQQLRQQVERRHDDPEPVERRPADDAGPSATSTITPTPTITSHGLRSSASIRSAPAEIVRQEERRQRDHDQVVEEERPAGHEARQVVERAADERRGAARLGQRSGAFGVRERDDQEEHAGREQHERREAERVRGEHAEREVDRRGDLAVGDGEEGARVELALAARAACVATSGAPPQHVEPADAGRDEEQAEDDADAERRARS